MEKFKAWGMTSLTARTPVCFLNSRRTNDNLCLSDSTIPFDQSIRDRLGENYPRTIVSIEIGGDD